LVAVVKKKVINDKVLFICEECGLAYEDESWAEKCEDFCSKHHACSIEITRHAVRVMDEQ